jgi:uncharacterized protein YndB with AHSA1/START domain
MVAYEDAMQNQITRATDIAASPEQVWAALTDHRSFSQWFGVQLQAPFVPGQQSQGPMTLASCEGLILKIDVLTMEAPRRFAWRWPAFDTDAKAYAYDQPWTDVVFHLLPVAGGTRLTVTETGFAALGEGLAARALAGNTGGWAFQFERLERFCIERQAA